MVEEDKLCEWGVAGDNDKVLEIVEIGACILLQWHTQYIYMHNEL